MNPPTGWKRFLWPLLSRKVQVAVGGAVGAYLVQLGFEDFTNKIVGLLSVLAPALTLILGIAVEDAGAKVGLPPPSNTK